MDFCSQMSSLNILAEVNALDYAGFMSPFGSAPELPREITPNPVVESKDAIKRKLGLDTVFIKRSGNFMGKPVITILLTHGVFFVLFLFIYSRTSMARTALFEIGVVRAKEC